MSLAPEQLPAWWPLRQVSCPRGQTSSCWSNSFCSISSNHPAVWLSSQSEDREAVLWTTDRTMQSNHFFAFPQENIDCSDVAFVRTTGFGGKKSSLLRTWHGFESSYLLVRNVVKSELAVVRTCDKAFIMRNYTSLFHTLPAWFVVMLTTA